jgi:hypothetical protein
LFGSKDEYLRRVMRGEGAGVGLELNAKFRAETNEGVTSALTPRRSHWQLSLLALTIQEARLEREARELAAKTKKRLDSLLARLPEPWDQVESLMNTKKVNEYDLAVKLLVELRELANRGDIADFDQRVADFRSRHSTKRALLERMNRAGLTGDLT